MRPARALIPSVIHLLTLLFFVTRFVSGATLTDSPNSRAAADDSLASPAVSEQTIAVKWNLNKGGTPLLDLPENQLNSGLERSLTYKLDQFRFQIFQALSYDGERSRYLLPALTESGKAIHFVEFPVSDNHTYSSTDGSQIRLLDTENMKTISTNDGTKYIFVRHPDGEFRCVLIKEASGAVLHLLYTANSLMLHGIQDGNGRSVTFDYDRTGIKSVTQTWMADQQGFTRTWTVKGPKPAEAKIEYSHAVSLKTLPASALVRQYTPEMGASDGFLARIFGGPNAVASANGFEPAGLSMTYPLYRGDVIGDDGVRRRGHLSFAMHLYGGADGNGDSPLYVPAGFTLHSTQPSPTDAAVTFYYPTLGNQTDVTLAVFHVADFQIRNEGNRVRIGNLGGPGGSSPRYKHSHVEFYRGKTGLPTPSARAHLRIDPAKVLSATSRVN